MQITKIQQTVPNKNLNLNHTKPVFASSSWQIQEDDEFVKIPKKRYKIEKAIEYIVTGILFCSDCFHCTIKSFIHKGFCN